MIKLKALLEDTFANKFPKNKWIALLHRGDREELKRNLYVLIDNAYGPIGGHVRIGNPDQILDPQLTYWEAVDIDIDPDADAVIFGQKRNGVKISGIGHDGNSKSKSELMEQQAKILNREGYWIESSGRPAQIKYAKNVPYVQDQATVEQLFGQPVVRWMDRGQYIRKIDANTVTDVETVFGKPTLT